MAIAYQNKSEVSVPTAQTSITIPVPTGFLAGDLLIACIVMNRASYIYWHPAPTGWTLIRMTTGTGGTHCFEIWYRIAEEGDTEWTWTIRYEGSYQQYGVILRYTGQAAENFIHASGVTTQEAANNSPIAPDVAYTDLKGGSLALQAFGADDDDTPYTTPVQLTERYNGISNTGSGTCGSTGGDKVVGGTGSTGTAEFTMNASEEWTAITVVIASAVGIIETAGIIAGQSSTTASLSGGTIEIAGIINSIPNITGTLITDFSITGQINGVSSTIGNLEFVAIFISGTINGISSITANLGIAYSVQGQINAISSITSVLGIVHTIQGQIGSISSISASLYGGSVLLNGQIDAIATIISNLGVTYLVQGQIDGVSDLATAALINLGLIDTTQVRILDRDENLKKIVDVISLKETFRLSKERHISLSLKELPDNFACGWYIYTVLPTESNWLDCSKWRVERYNISNDSGGISYDIHAEHYSCELLDEAKTLELTTSSATNAITQALSGTTWSIGTVNTPNNYDLKIERKISVLDILQRIAKRWKGELYFKNNRTVDLKTQIGENNNLWFRYDKNIKDIEVSYNSQDVVTRLYPYGKEELNISSVNAGKEYLDSTYIGDYPRPKIGVLETQYAEAQKLKDYALDYLSNVEIPTVTYELDIADLSFLTKYLYEKFKIGDTVTIFDKDLDLKISTRIIEIRRDYCYSENSSIVLSNELKLLTDFIKEIQDKVGTSTSASSEDVVSLPPAQLPICFVIYVGGILTAGIYQGAIIWVHTHCHAVEIMAYAKWKPTVSDVIVGLAHNGTRVDSVTIPFGEYVAPGEGEVGAGGTTSINLPLAPFDRLNIDIDAADGVAQGLIVEVRCEK